MSIIALSTCVGSQGDEIGREVASVLQYDFVDREVIARAADRFGGDAAELRHVTEERPTLWERFVDTKRHFVTYVEATIMELAARDRVVLAGLGAAMVLRGIPQALRVRVTAPEHDRALRVEHQQGLTPEASLDTVRAADRERAARVRFLHHVDWEDPRLYDLVLNTARLTVPTAVRVLVEALKDERYQTTPEALARTRDLALVAQARATLLADPATRGLALSIGCHDGVLTASGFVFDEGLRRTAEDLLRRLPGTSAVRTEITVVSSRPSYARMP